MSTERRTLLIALAIVGGGFLVCAGIGVGVVLLSRLPPAERPATSKVWTRDEFRKTAMGKTPDEIIATFGKPDVTREYPDDSPNWWIYWGKATNPATGRAGDATVEFANGRVVKVSW